MYEQIQNDLAMDHHGLVEQPHERANPAKHTAYFQIIAVYPAMSNLLSQVQTSLDLTKMMKMVNYFN